MRLLHLLSTFFLIFIQACNGSREANAITDLIFESSHPFPTQNCHVLTFGMGQAQLKDLIHECQGQGQFINVQEEAGPELLSKISLNLKKHSWCVFAVIPIRGKALNLDKINKVIEVVKNRRFIFIADSKTDTFLVPASGVNCPSFMLEKKSDTKNYYLHLFCHNCLFPTLRNVDYWTPSTSFIMKSKNYFAPCCLGKTELYGKRLVVSAFGSTPYIQPKFDPVTQEMTYGGGDIEIITELAKKFRFIPVPKVEKTWGNFVDGHWTGTIASVENGTSHFGIGHVSITYDRYQVVDYSVPTYLVEYGHFSLKPTRLDPFRNIVMPFDNAVWGFIVLTVTVVALSFLITFHVYSSLGWRLPFRLGKMHHPLDFVLLPLGMLVTQDRVRWFNGSSKVSAGSLLVLVWSMSALVMTLSYLSTLRASLIAVEYTKPVDSIQDILDRDEDLWYIKGTSLLENLRTSPVAQIRALHDQVIRHNTFYDYAGAIPEKQLKAMVESGQGSLISHKIGDLTARAPISAVFGGEFPFHFSKELHITVYAGIVVQKHCLYVDHINKAITGLLEFGIIDHFFYKDVPLRSFITESVKKIKTVDAPKPLEFLTVASSIIFLGIMHCLSLSIFLVERGNRLAQNDTITKAKVKALTKRP